MALEDSDLRIRAYQSADLDALIAIFRDAVRVTARRDYSAEEVTAWAPDEIDSAAWATRCARNKTFIAVLDRRIVGFSELSIDGLIDMLYVAPAFARRGVASRLLAAMESVAEERGLSRLSTNASITARPFFENRGFHIIGPQAAIRRGHTLTNYRMQRIMR